MTRKDSQPHFDEAVMFACQLPCKISVAPGNSFAVYIRSLEAIVPRPTSINPRQASQKCQTSFVAGLIKVARKNLYASVPLLPLCPTNHRKTPKPSVTVHKITRHLCTTTLLATDNAAYQSIREASSKASTNTSVNHRSKCSLKSTKGSNKQ